MKKVIVPKTERLELKKLVDKIGQIEVSEGTGIFYGTLNGKLNGTQKLFVCDVEKIMAYLQTKGINN